MIFFNNWKTKRLSKLFKAETIKYVKQVNEFRAEGMKSKWQDKMTIEAPTDTREKYAHDIYKAILKFNKKGKIQELRELFPPQTEIFYSLIQEKSSIANIHKIVAVSDEIFLVAVDEPKFSVILKQRYLKKNCYVYKRGSFTRLENIIDFGICPQKKVFAYVKSNSIILKNGWDGDILSTINLSKHATVYFADDSVAQNDVDISDLSAKHYIPFSDGKRILIGGQDFGLLLLESDKCTVVFPSKQDCIRHQESQEDSDSTENALDWVDFSMFHVALSHDNNHIAVGHQHSSHALYTVDGVLLGETAPLSAYPHYALFSKDDSHIMFNSCHFYNGATLDCQIKDMMSGDPVPENKIIELDMESRVYAAVSTSYGYIIGDAYGYIRARNHDGDYLWDDYLGFNIQTMDITCDEKFLYVGTYEGIVYKIHLNYGEKSPYQIGNSNNMEVSRWMFWEKNNILTW